MRYSGTGKVRTASTTTIRTDAARLLIVALRLLAEGSHESLTIAEKPVTSWAISKGSFYHHFGGLVGLRDRVPETWERESTPKS